VFYICNVIKTKQHIMTTQELKNNPMLQDLLKFANAINFEMKSEESLKELLKIWVNHRVEVTPQMTDYLYNDYKNNN